MGNTVTGASCAGLKRVVWGGRAAGELQNGELAGANQENCPCVRGLARGKATC
jgi:hypothetical protein